MGEGVTDEERARLLDLAHDAIIIRDWAGPIRYWNGGATRLYGWAAKDAVGRDLHALLRTDLLPDRRAAIESHLKHHGWWEGTFSQRCRSGNPVVVDVRKVPMTFADGTTGVMEINRDATARVAAEGALRAANASLERRVRERTEALDGERGRLAALLEQAPAAMAVMHGPDHRYTLANLRYLSLARKGKDDLIGRSVEEAFPEARAQGFIDLLDGVYASGEPYGGEAKPFVSTGMETRYITFIYEPMRDDRGAVEGVFVHALDVTTEVESRRRVEAILAGRNAFIAQVAHELRTPTTTIKGNAQLLLKRLVHQEESSVKAIRTARRLSDEAHRLEKITERLVNLAIQEADIPLDR